METRRDEQSGSCAFDRTSPMITLAITALAVTSMFGCEEVPQFSAQRTLTSTVTLDRETLLDVDSVVPLAIVGEPRSDDLHLSLDATVTASTSTRAKRLADALELAPETDGDKITLKLAAPSGATLSGTLEIGAPPGLDLAIVERGGTVDIEDVDGTIQVVAASHVRVVGATGDTSVGVARGNALVDTSATPGSTTLIEVDAGDIELTLPQGLSADILAVAQGQIYIAHPRLPPFLGRPGDVYSANVSGGLAVFRLETRAGKIVIRTR
ncbi:hypothetical protein L6R52_38470 [Myxococcota bacterium]|nr:hypothetical protein [Myxococcota bacterium]